MNTSTITPDPNIPDDELRALRCFIAAVEVAHEYLRDVADARAARGIDTFPQEADADTLLALALGYRRAADRRVRDLGALLVNDRIAKWRDSGAV
jgi:hypothetical protein